MKKMESPFINDFLAFEESNNLFELKYKGFQYWPYLRWHVYTFLYAQKYQFDSLPAASLHKPSFWQRLSHKTYMLGKAIYKNPLWIRGCFDILLINHERKKKEGSFYQDIYTGFLTEHFGKRALVWDRSTQGIHQTPQSSPLLFDDFFFYFTKLQFKLFAQKKDRLHKLQSLHEQIEQTFGIAPAIKTMCDLIQWAYFLKKTYDLFLPVLFKRCQIKLIVSVVAYDIPVMCLNEVAKTHGIQTIELQHGTMGHSHIAYNYPKKQEVRTFPQNIFVFSQFWKDTTRFPLAQNNVWVTGARFMERSLTQFPPRNISGKKVILIESQLTIGKQLAKFIHQMLQKQNLDDYRILYKLHPSECKSWENNYPELCAMKEKIEIVWDRNISIYNLFAQSSIQIGVYSTSLFEGLAYGLKTLIVKLPGYEYMNDLIHNNYAILLEHPDDFLKAIETKTQEVDVSYFWEKKAQEKTITALEKLLFNHSEKG